MSTQDLEADLARCRMMLEAAGKAYWESKFNESEELYRACLAMLETVYVTDSADIAVCLQGLGDSYYFQNNYGLALPYFKRLLASRERMADTNAPEFITALYKLAKTYDKLNEFEEAEALFKRAYDLGQKKLSLGHPLLTSLLEAYAKFLKKVKPGAELAIEEKARLSREKYVDPKMLADNILEGVGGQKTETGDSAGKKSKIWFTSSIAEESDHWLVKVMVVLKENKRLTYAILLSPLITAFSILTISVAYSLWFDNAPQNALVLPGQTYQTVDGHAKIAFSREKAMVNQNGFSSSKPYHQLSNRWRELVFAFDKGNDRNPWRYKTTDAISGIKGGALWKSDSPKVKLASAAKDVAISIYNEWEETKTIPDVFDDGRQVSSHEGRDSFAKVTYVNPYTGNRQEPRWVRLERGNYADGQTQLNNSIASAETIGDALRINGVTLNLGGVRNIAAGDIVCFTLSDESPAPVQSTNAEDEPRVEPRKQNHKELFYVLPVVSASGQLLESCEPNQALFWHGSTGSPPVISCQGAPTSSDESMLVISRRTKESLVGLGQLIGLDLILLIPFVIGTQMLVESSSAKHVSEANLRHKMGQMQIAFALYLPFALSYMTFTAYVLFQALFGW